MIAVALVPISKDLGVSSATVIWLVVSLYLVSAISQPTMGTLADRIGPRTVLVVGSLTVIVASVLPLLFPTFGAVLAARILLGIGSSAAYPGAITMIRHRTAALGIPTPPSLLAALSIAGLASGVVGPVLGGLLIGAFSWQAIFAVNIPIAAASLVMTLAWLPADVRVRGTSIVRSLDLGGMALFAASITALVFFLLDLPAQRWWLLAIFVVSGVGLVLWERRRPRPFIDVRLLVTEGALTRTYVRLFLVSLGPYVVVYGVSQWLQDVRGLTSAEAGLVQFPSLLLAGIASLAVARTTRVRWPLIVTAVLCLVTGVLLATAGLGPLWIIVAAIALVGIPQGLSSVSNQAVVYRVAPHEQVGAASGLSRTAISLTAIVTSSMIGLVFGDLPSDAGVQLMGWIVAGAALVATVMTVLDRSLRD